MKLIIREIFGGMGIVFGILMKLIRKIFGGTVITVGMLMVSGALGTSDYDSEYLVSHPHPLWMLLVIALTGGLIAWAGYRICVPKRTSLR